MGYGLLYRRVTRHATEEGRLRIDDLLGLEGAAEAYAELRKGTATDAGYEVG